MWPTTLDRPAHFFLQKNLKLHTVFLATIDELLKAPEDFGEIFQEKFGQAYYVGFS